MFSGLTPIEKQLYSFCTVVPTCGAHGGPPYQVYLSDNGPPHQVYLSDKHHTTESAQAARKLFELAGVRAREFVPRDFAKDTSPILEAVRDTVLTDPDRSSSAAISFCTSIRPVLSTFSWVVVGAACHHFSDRERGKVTLERMGRGVFESKVGGLLESVLRRVGGSSLRGVGLTRGTGR